MTKPNSIKADATNFRQRAARARDAAGRFIKRSGSVATAAEPDPVLDLIEDHRAAYAAFDQAAAAWDGISSDDPRYPEAMAATTAPDRREAATYEALFTGQPTTIAGAASLGSYLAEAIRRRSSHTEHGEGERALRFIASAVSRLDRPSEVARHPDAALFELGEAFLTAWVAEGDDGGDLEYRACLRIAQEIMRAPAATVAGYGIKALLLARLDSDGTGPHKPIEVHGPPDSWWNALRQVQQGAARLAAAGPDSEIPKVAGAGALSVDIMTCWREGAAIPDENQRDGDPLYERWYARRDALLEAADRLAATWVNLAPKALALAWLEYADLWERGRTRADYAMDGRLAFDINAIASGHTLEITTGWGA